MARKPSGWKIRQRTSGGAYYVRFWLHGREIERSTGSSESQEAARAASRIYASEVGKAGKKAPRRRGATPPLEELVAEWLTSLETTHAANTVKTVGLYASGHWIPFFAEVFHINELMCVNYRNERLGLVLASTVRKELSALRSFIVWLVQHGHLGEPVNVPGVSKRSTGKKHPEPRRQSAIALTPDECARIIAELPDWSTSRKVEAFPIRARFLVAYETGLRPSTLDKLTAGVHYSRGHKSITLAHDIDKNRYGREVPLSDAARAALDSVCPKEGLIFGRHVYGDHTHAAAVTVLGSVRAKKFCPAHLRSARITHWAERTKNLSGIQYLAGHKSATTTAKYMRPSLRAALDVLEETAPSGKKKQQA